MTRIRGRNRSKLINIDLEFDIKTLKTWMMENEKKSTVGGLFAVNTSANHISLDQQTGSLFNTYLQAAPPTESSDHYPNVPFNQEDCEKSTLDSPSQVLPNPKLRPADITQTGAGEQ